MDRITLHLLRLGGKCALSIDRSKEMIAEVMNTWTVMRMLRCGLDAKTGPARDRLQQHPAQCLLTSSDGYESPEMVELCTSSMPRGTAVTKRGGLEIIKVMKHVFGWTEAHGQSVLAEPRFRLPRQRGTLMAVTPDPCPSKPASHCSC